MTRFSSLAAELGQVALDFAEQAHRNALDDDAVKFVDLAHVIFDRSMLDLRHSAPVVREPDDA